MRSGFFRNLKYSSFGRKCGFFAEPLEHRQILWHIVWVTLPRRPGKQVGAIKLAQVSVSWPIRWDTLWSYSVHIKRGIQHTASRGPSWRFCSLSLLFAWGQVSWSTGKLGGGNKSTAPGSVLQERSADQVGWWGAQNAEAKKGPKCCHSKEQPQSQKAQLLWETVWELLRKVKHSVTKWRIKSIPSYIAKRKEDTHPHKNPYTKVHGSSIHNSPKVETT